jgi:hypothetical protein
LSVVAEAVFAGIVVRRVVRDEMPHAAKGEPLTLARFVRFYTPLALTPTLLFAAMPIGTAAMSRMPLAMESLATWPVISGFAFTLRSTGFALNEVVVALLERPRALRALRRFAWTLGAVTSGMMLLVAATPLGHLWFERVAALSPVLLALATTGAWWAFLLPGGTALQSLYQGAIVHSGRTRSVTESMAIYLLMLALVLAAGVAFQRWTGLFVALAAVTAGLLAQVGWLAWRARASLRTLAAEDTAA